jgi:hypothetical protein
MSLGRQRLPEYHLLSEPHKFLCQLLPEKGVTFVAMLGMAAIRDRLRGSRCHSHLSRAFRFIDKHELVQSLSTTTSCLTCAGMAKQTGHALAWGERQVGRIDPWQS